MAGHALIKAGDLHTRTHACLLFMQRAWGQQKYSQKGVSIHHITSPGCTVRTYRQTIDMDGRDVTRVSIDIQQEKTQTHSYKPYTHSTMQTDITFITQHSQ